MSTPRGTTTFRRRLERRTAPRPGFIVGRSPATAGPLAARTALRGSARRAASAARASITRRGGARGG